MLLGVRPDAHQRLAAWIADAFETDTGRGWTTHPLVVRYGETQHLTVRGVPATGIVGRYLPTVRCCCSGVTDSAVEQNATPVQLRDLYDLTRSEARLVGLLMRERALLPAAKAMGVTHGTARGYLKTAFQKVGVNSQAQLVARIVRDTIA